MTDARRSVNLGPFTVRCDPAEPGSLYTRYTVTFAGVDLGSQVSQLTLADCFEHARRALVTGKVSESVAAQLREHGAVGAPVLRLPGKGQRFGHNDAERHARARGARRRRSA